MSRPPDKPNRLAFLPLRITLVWCGALAALATLCAACPVSNSLVLRPIIATVNLDGSYGSLGVPPAAFDRAKWQTRQARHRVAMAHHLADNNLLEGKTRAELVEMLGEPDVDKPGDEGVRWLLGYYAKGLFDESMWLVLTIAEDGKATGAGVWKDWYDPRRK